MINLSGNVCVFQGKLSPSFETMIGLRQGDSLSTLLFNLCMGKIIRNFRINPSGTIYNRTRQCLAYVDDVVILGRSEGYIKETLEEMVAITQQIGLQMNDTKTKYMLTLRLLMSYIYMEHVFLMFLDHTQRRSTVGRTPLDE